MILTHDNTTQHVDEWAADYGIPANLITLRIAAGWTTAAAIETEMPVTTRALKLHRRDLRVAAKARKDATRSPPQARKPSRQTILTHAGEMLSIRQWADRIGVKSDTIHARLKSGYSIEHALTPGDYRAEFNGVEPTVFITYRGITRSVSRWSRITGVKVATIRYRHARGWTPDRILNPELVKKPRDRGVGRASEVFAGTGALPTAQVSA